MHVFFSLIYLQVSRYIEYKYKCSSDINGMFKANMWVGKDEINEEVCVHEGEIFENDILLKTYSHVNLLKINEFSTNF